MKKLAMCHPESLLGEGTLECGSASYRRLIGFQGGSFAAALHDGLRIFLVSGRRKRHERLR
ncbi:MAG: hypothetical protein ABSF46_32305 [Terriglobia bacterium]